MLPVCVNGLKPHLWTEKFGSGSYALVDAQALGAKSVSTSLCFLQQFEETSASFLFAQLFPVRQRMPQGEPQWSRLRLARAPG